VGDVDIQEAAYHFLVRSAMLFGLLFEKVYRILAQSDCDFDLFFVESQFTRRRQEIIYNPDIAYGLIRVSYFLFHNIYTLSTIQINSNIIIHNIVCLI